MFIKNIVKNKSNNTTLLNISCKNPILVIHTHALHHPRKRYVPHLIVYIYSHISSKTTSKHKNLCFIMYI